MQLARSFLGCVGLALSEKGRRALSGDVPYGEVLLEVARTALDYTRRELPSDEIRLALREIAAADAGEFADALSTTLSGPLRTQATAFREPLEAYLGSLPTAIRQILRRPSDPTGKTVPDKVPFARPEDLLLFLPARPPLFHPAGEPVGLDHWVLTESIGLGECSEVWIGTDDDHPNHPPVALKFATDPTCAEQVLAHRDLFAKVFEMNHEPGLVPLQSVFLHTDPPCLESVYVWGYDLTALMYDWKWRYDTARPEAALKLIRRIAEIVGKTHRKGFVHRDLKPSNVLLHPSEGGRFTVWVTDLGWGQIQAARSVELSRSGTPRGEQTRLALRGSYTPLYTSPQVNRKEAPDPRDDVHALGIMWYQLLKRDPHAPAPVGPEWVEEFRSAGLTDSQAELLNQCIASRPDKRPADAAALAEKLQQVVVMPQAVPDGSRLLKIQPQSGYQPPARGPAVAMAAVAAPAKVETLPRAKATTATNSIGMVFALIPAGTYLMGSPDNENGRREHEGPQREVTITRPFYLSIFPVTQGQFQRMMGQNPAQFNHSHCGGPDHPVETVTWHQAQEFCAKIGLLPREEQQGRSYRLPTEAEWEYACRAGTTTAYSFGDKITPKDAHFMAPGAFGKTGGQGRTAPTGKWPANAFGLHDMHGNVLEWVSDWYDAFYYQDGPDEDPTGPEQGKQKVVRGGCWAMFANECRSAARRAQDPEKPTNSIGFRVVMEVPAETE